MKVNLVALARPTFDLEIAQTRFEEAIALLCSLGATVLGPGRLIMTPQDVSESRLEDSDHYILLLASFSDASPAIELLGKVKKPILLWSLLEPGAVGERLKLNSLCGANLAAHALTGVGQSVRHIHGNPETSLVKEKLLNAFAGRYPSDEAPEAIHSKEFDSKSGQDALNKLATQRIGIIGEAPIGFTPCEYDEAQINKLFGLSIIPITVNEAFSKIEAVPVQVTQDCHDHALNEQPSLGRVNREEALKVASVEGALKSWIEEESLDAIAIRCWPEFPTEMGACVCSAMGRLADLGTVTTCERDVLGAVTMLLIEALGCNQNYLVDIVDLDASENVIRLWHCGSAATKLAADPSNATQTVHCNRKLGVAGDFPLRTGPVTLVRLDRDLDPKNSSGLRMIVSRGESIPAPNQFQGNTATVKTDCNAAALVNGMVTRGYPHHLVISWADVRPGLRSVATKIGIPLNEW